MPQKCIKMLETCLHKKCWNMLEKHRKNALKMLRNASKAFLSIFEHFYEILIAYLNIKKKEMLLRSQMQHLFSANLGEMHFSNCSSISKHFSQHFPAFLVKVHFQNCFRKNPKSEEKNSSLRWSRKFGKRQECTKMLQQCYKNAKVCLKKCKHWFYAKLNRAITPSETVSSPAEPAPPLPRTRRKCLQVQA